MYLILLNNFSFLLSWSLWLTAAGLLLSLLWAVVRGRWKSWEDQTALVLGSEGIAVHAALNSCRNLFHKLKLFVSKAWVLTIASWMGAVATKASLQTTTSIAGREWRWSRAGQSQLDHLFLNFEQQSKSKPLSLGSDWQIKQPLYTWARSGIWPYGIPVTRELEEEFREVALQAVKTICLCYLANFVNRESRWEVIFHLQPWVRPAAQLVEPVFFKSSLSGGQWAIAFLLTEQDFE